LGESDLISVTRCKYIEQQSVELMGMQFIIYTGKKIIVAWCGANGVEVFAVKKAFDPLSTISVEE